MAAEILFIACVGLVICWGIRQVLGLDRNYRRRKRKQ